MVGIIILNYINYADTFNCIESIVSTTVCSSKIYIVDNASPNDSASRIENYISGKENISLIRNNCNSGYAAGNNLGIKQALCDGCSYFLVTNADVLFMEHSIDNMLNYLESNKHVGLIGPKILSPNHNELYVHLYRYTGIREKYLIRTFLRAFNLGGVVDSYYGRDADRKKPHEIYAASGCCFCFSSAMANFIYPFDENTFLYSEEYIIGIKAAQSGLKSYFLPGAAVVHLEKSNNITTAYSYTQNFASEIYYCKNYMNTGLFLLLPLFIYRVLVYFLRSAYNTRYRTNLKYFLNTTAIQLKKKHFTNR